MSESRYETSFKALQRINHIAARVDSPDELLSAVLNDMLGIFQCDRAFLIYPCDPDAPSWRVARERTQPDWPGGLAMDVDFPMTPENAAVCRSALDSVHPLAFDWSGDAAIPVAKRFSIRAQLVMAIRPKMDKPWMFGIHHCAQPHVYTPEEATLFEDIGKRVAEAITPRSAVDPAWTGDPNAVDLSLLAEWNGGNRSNMREFVLSFLESARRELTEIEAALERNDLATLSTLGHHNRAPAIMAGATGFANLCQALEHGKDGLNLEQARDIVSQMRPLLDRINQQIDKDLT